MAVSTQTGNDPDAGIHDHDPHEIDKNFLYGNYQAVEDYKLERRKTHDAFMDDAARKAIDTPIIPGDDDMKVNSDNTIHNHYGSDAKPTKTATETPQPAQESNTLRNLGIAAALLAGGAGLGAGAVALTGGNEKPEPPAAEKFTDTDTDNVTIGVPSVID